MTFWTYISRSTLKREFATAVMGWYMALTTWLIFGNPSTIAKQMWDALLLPVFALAGAAYGTDWISKQTTIAGPPSNTETTVKTEVTDTAAVVTTSSEMKDP